MKDNKDAFGLDAYEIISSHIKEFDYPVAFKFPIGHTNNNFAVPVGFPASLSVGKTKVLLDIGEYKPGNKTGKND
jgi:muramoyltetrapeptide carboxypeptidase